MGSYAQCWFDDFFVGSSKNDINLEIISLFRATDKRIISDPNVCVPEHLKHYQESRKDDDELQIVYYEASASLIRDRLDVMGYTLETSKEAFIEWIQGERNCIAEYLKEEDESDRNKEFSLKDHYKKEEQLLSGLTPETWIAALNDIRRSGLKPNYYGRYEGPHEDTLIGYMLSNEWYGFPGYDMNVPLRLVLEDSRGDEKLVYDVTDLVWSGYFDAADDLVEHGVALSANEYSSKAKTIILTEGFTDSWILKESLKLLYPHLADYYSFMEFDNAKVGGGVGSLANMVKAFAGAGVVNNIIALFDNDTAAEAACRNLEKIQLPANIEIIKLPEVDLLKNYPTIGPTGDALLDINGIAASIELYLGEDVLKIDGQNLTPIQWTGFESGVKKYQGEVLEKKVLQERFREKLLKAKSCGDEGPDISWDALRAILKLIFSAFKERNRKSICRLASDYYTS